MSPDPAGAAPGAEEARRRPTAIISDIHANLPALRAALADIAARGVGRIVCLGDIVGYGPDPVACWRLVRERCGAVIRGNHDHALGAGEMRNFHPRARNAVAWTRREILREPDGEGILRDLTSLPIGRREGDFLYVHGSPAGPLMDYLLPADSRDRHRMAEEFAAVDLYAVNGHTHIPGVIVRGTGFLPPAALADGMARLMGCKMIVNAGSVGQPRDGDPRACYVTVDEGGAYFHRVEYDAGETCRRIQAVPELDPYLGERLLTGH